MSITTDLLHLLDDESNAFAFLPALNNGYLYWQMPNPSLGNTCVFGISILIGAIAYNILNKVDFEEYRSDSHSAMPISSTSLLLIFGIIWLFVFGYSLILLWGRLLSGNIWPVLLTAVSLVVISLLLTDWILELLLPMYYSQK